MSQTKAQAKQPVNIVNWILDHAMILIIILMAIYVEIQRPQFFGVASLMNIVNLTAARLPMALGVAGCIILAGTDLSGGRVAGLTAFISAILLQKAGVANRFLEGGSPWFVPFVILVVMAVGACVGCLNGFCMGKFKLHPFIVRRMPKASPNHYLLPSITGRGKEEGLLLSALLRLRSIHSIWKNIWPLLTRWIA